MNPAIEERIRARAYAIWEEEGRPQGRDVEHWIRAVLELAREGSIRLLPDGVLQTDVLHHHPDDATDADGHTGPPRARP